ncbi:heterokaryon incompatibility protein-domain-containing protein [Boeremia exigua]|uniref:heterokaryon incompatibility protein-domain-containing protein n=1 Tax=Boeremia exigua TaxID=749465 RepID=UPI001E8DDDE4|nr:heterokaryon incompatibility protein-domain-containing protein [Boeremia exigua]KAH6622270.1 heterokaryon incompatibility protein-domain-containing protein [Boeremia exigua]
MTLCQLCNSISLTKMRGPNLDQMQPHQPSYLALKRSADAGCQLCGFFWSALEQGSGKDRQRSFLRAALAQVCEQYPGRQLSLAAWGGSQASLDRIYIVTTGEVPEVDDETAPSDPTMHPDHQHAAYGVVDLYAEADDAAAYHGGVTGRPLPLSAGSDVDFEQARMWTQDCLNNHAACPKPSVETPLPTRVIEVCAPNEPIELRLLESHGMKGSYIALSHCWGGQVPLTTTTATLEDRTRSIPFERLPKTFQEAVIVVRRLGVRYLWIDSLCILQDCRVDWEKESAVMGNIYASGFVTIAARGSVNSEGGLFIPREVEPPPCRLPYECTQHSISGSMYIRSPVFQHERLRDAPLDTRAWTFQERLLSPRIIYFGRHQLYWECAESTIRQDGRAPDVATDDLRSGRGFKQDLDINSPLPYTTSTVFLRDYQESSSVRRFERRVRLLRWYTIVEEYSLRNLTYQSDKLPALSGIAKMFEKRTGYTYLAGLWKEDLIVGIAWYASQSSTEVISDTLPSWTWARLKGEVGFWCSGIGLPLRELEESCEMVHVKYTLASTHNSYGGIGNAALEVQGRLIEVVYRSPQSPQDEFPTTLFSVAEVPVGRVKFDLQSSESHERSFFCLLIHGGEHYPAALALESTGSTLLPSYKRIGFVTFDPDWWELQGKAAFKAIQPCTVFIL